MKKFIPSIYQQAIADFVLQVGKKINLIIQAVAGSGKTTTIVWLVSLLSSTKTILFLAFNKAIAVELTTRLATYRNAQAKTFNSLGHGVWTRYIGKRFIMLKPNKSQRILWDMFPSEKGEDGKFKQHPTVTKYGNFVTRLVGLAKNEGIGCLVPNELEQWQALIAKHDLTLDHKDATQEKGIELAQAVFAESIAQGRNVIDFDDQLFLPIFHGAKFPRFDFVLVDEFQDTNKVQQAILVQLLEHGGQMVAVGDTHQAIYGFRGADAEAMQRARDTFNCHELPLSVSYRISKAVCAYAQKFVAHITTPDNAPQGKVKTLASYTRDMFKSTDAIICRNVAPLVAFAYACIAQGISVKILGRKIGEDLAKLITKLAEGKTSSIDTLLDLISEYRNREVTRLTSKGDALKAEGINDTCDCIVFLIDNLTESNRTLAGLIASIDNLFTDHNAGRLTLCTAHKSKGLEFPRVFILDKDTLMPSKYATQDWQIEQEKNLIYVAATRAMLELYFITSGQWTDKRSTTPSATITPPAMKNVIPVNVAPASPIDEANRWDIETMD